MKKIVGIIAAVAMAASVFAMDFSGGFKVEGSLFDLTAKSGSKPSALSVGTASGGFYWGTRIQTAFYGDKAGAQFALSYHGWEDAATDLYLRDQKIWVQPIDMLKITMLNVGDKLNASFVDDKSVLSVGGAWQFEVKPVDAFTATFTLAGPWLNNGVIGDTGLTFKYAADFGTIGFMYTGSNNFKAHGLALGYAGTFDAISMFADAGLTLSAAGVDNFNVDAQVIASLDAFKLSTYVLFSDKAFKFDKANISVLLRFKAEYNLGSATAYLSVSDDNLLSDPFDMVFNPGVAFNIGAAGCDIGVKIETKNDVKISVPFSVGVNF